MQHVQRLLMTLRNETGPFATRIKQHVDRLTQSRIDIFDESSRKRGAPNEPTDGLDNAKRARLGTELNIRQNVPPLPPGPTSTAQLFTLTSEEGLTSFNVTVLPIDLVVRITLPVLQRIDQENLNHAINAVRSRYHSLRQAQQTAPQGPPLIPTASALDDDEDDYEPDFEPTEDTEQIMNKEDAISTDDPRQAPKDIALGPFKLPQPPPLTGEEAEQLGKVTISRVFSMMNVLEEPAKAPKPGLHRLAGSNYDKEAWITVITRLATRASSGLQDAEEEVKQENAQAVGLRKGHSLSNGIRETLWKYIIEDFRVRIPIAIAWLNEEWYNDRVMDVQSIGFVGSSEQRGSTALSQKNYEKWVLKVLDGIVPYLDAKDKVLIRFLSEIPGISGAVLERIKSIARDPDRVTLAVNAIQ